MDDSQNRQGRFSRFSSSTQRVRCREIELIELNLSRVHGRGCGHRSNSSVRRPSAAVGGAARTGALGRPHTTTADHAGRPERPPRRASERHPHRRPRRPVCGDRRQARGELLVLGDGAMPCRHVGTPLHAAATPTPTRCAAARCGVRPAAERDPIRTQPRLATPTTPHRPRPRHHHHHCRSCWSTWSSRGRPSTRSSTATRWTRRCGSPGTSRPAARTTWPHRRTR